MKTKKLILLDSHAIIHRAFHALPEFTSAKSGEPTGALYGLVAMLLKMIQELKPDYIVAAFDESGPTFRHQAAESYKAGRKPNDESLDLQLERAKDIFKAFGIPIYSHPSFEADDIIGTIVKHEARNSKLEIIIASGDMDTMQLVDGKKVQVYTLKKGLNDTILYDEEKVIERFGFKPDKLIDYKGLRGDPSDNIIGVKGIGEKTATELIQKYGTIEEIYKVIKKGKADVTERVKKLLIEGEEEALFSKTLATIRTDAPIKFSLPQEWRENFDVNKVLELFKELGFKTLSERVKKLFDKDGSQKKIAEVLTLSSGAPTTSEFSSVSPKNSYEEKELCLMLSVIDSNFTAPKLEDVFDFTKTVDLKEARKILESELDKREVRFVFENIERPLMPVVERMNERGVKVDKKVLDRLGKDYHKELDKIQHKIWDLAGEEFNINSPKILGDILFNKLGLAEKRQKKTPTGALSTKESELEKLKDKHPIVALILNYRELSKLLSTYIDAIPPLLDKNSRLHSTFLQNGAVTGRMASTNPNLQNIPIKTALGRAIRNAFVAEHGSKLLSLDYSQIELRLAAILSGDQKLMEIFQRGEDAHAGVAARVFKVPVGEVDKAMRIKAKTINFGILYGMGVTALQKNLGTDRKEAQEFYNQYFSTFSGLAAYLDRVKADTERKGYTETMFGRRRYFSGFRSPLPYIRAQAERMAINAPIQGTQADIIKLAMRKIDDWIRRNGDENKIYLVLQVHDELVFEVSRELVDEAAKNFKKIMETVIPQEKMAGVPIVAEAHVGDNWGEMNRMDL